MENRKLLKFYFQSFLLGVPEIVVGFRSPRGEVQTLQTFRTLEIPRLVRGKPDAWDPSVCLAWGNMFLTQVHGWMKNLESKENGGESHDRRVGRILFTQYEGVTFRELDEEEIGEVRNGEDRIGFLPTWYMDSLRSVGTSKEG
jgi:RAT1-interacting protein